VSKTWFSHRAQTVNTVEARWPNLLASSTVYIGVSSSSPFQSSHAPSSDLLSVVLRVTYNLLFAPNNQSLQITVRNNIRQDGKNYIDIPTVLLAFLSCVLTISSLSAVTMRWSTCFPRRAFLPNFTQTLASPHSLSSSSSHNLSSLSLSSGLNYSSTPRAPLISTSRAPLRCCLSFLFTI